MRRDFYTIGYEGSRVEDFLRVLKQAGIETLIDVRDLPLSRKRGFQRMPSQPSLTATASATCISRASVIRSPDARLPVRASTGCSGGFSDRT